MSTKIIDKNDTPFNLNISRKPERNLDAHLIDEMINIYGVQCLWLFSERINVDKLVYRDFSHFKVNKDYTQITLLPENMENFDGDTNYNSFGIFQQFSVELFISAQGLLKLYPDFRNESGSRSKVVNSLLLTPGGQLLEISNVSSYDLGVSNQFAYADNPNSYKLTCKVYTPNISDEGVSEIKDSIKLQEGPKDDRIFEHEEPVNTSEIDKFFDDLEVTKKDQNIEGDKKSSSGGVFGNLS